MRVLFSPAIAKLAFTIGLSVVLYTCVRAQSALPPVLFASAMEAREFLVANGLHYHTGTTTDNSTFTTFYVADHPLTFDDTLTVAFRSDCGLTPEWKGKLWVAQIRNASGNFDLTQSSVHGKTRIWGSVIVGGDEALMDRVEELHRNQ